MSVVDPSGLDAGVKTVVVVGLGRSGIAAARLLATLGRRVVLSESGGAVDAAAIASMVEGGATLADGPQGEGHLAGADLVLKSPGVPAEAPIVAVARARGIPVWSEVELAYRVFRCPFSGVTGTNGKTTTTALLGHMFATAGLPARVLGNIGTAVTAVGAELDAAEELVVELSSFQLEDVHEFRPAAGVLLNLTPDHLDRHGSMERYLACKANMFARQRAGDEAVFNLDDPRVAELGRRVAGREDGPRVSFFSVGGVDGADSFMASGRLHLVGGSSVAVGDIRLRGPHNMENCLGAGTVALRRGVPAEAVIEALRTFPGVPHRLEPAGVVAGVAYVNDSKATNVEATLKAISAYPSGTHLILGGRDKASDYRPIARACAEGCRGVYLIGEATDLIAEAFDEVRKEGASGVPAPIVCGGLERAVEAAAKAASVGDTVLLAPACASFDQYSGFEERGRHFVEIVQRMGGCTA